MLVLLDDFVPLQELAQKLRLPKRWWLSVAIIPAVVLLATTGAMSILESSFLGFVSLLVTRSITIQQAYKSINWTVIFLLAAAEPSFCGGLKRAGSMQTE